MSDTDNRPTEVDGGPLDVVAVGNALVDVLAHATDDDLGRLGLVKGSMELVDLARSTAVYAGMGAGIEVSGGSAANTAVGVAALGGRVGYIGKVADDEFGATFLHDITAAGVVDRHLSRVPVSGSLDAERATGRCLVLVTEDGERTMATHLGVASALGPDDLDEGLLARGQVVYLEGYLWDQPPAKTALRRAMEVAHGADALVALSLSDPFCVTRHRREFLDLLHGEIDVLFANADEVTLLFDVAGFDAAVSAVEETGLLAALTRGAAGSVVVAAGGPVAVAAEPVDRVVDTTGAGDLYAAGFLYGLTHGYEPESCAKLAGLCAGEVISHLGARPQSDLRLVVEAAGLS
ncbi:MAG TPA: adenosine kinase [Acidimicrobiales bacterium]|nr:adenosine kinase [Acidimicrobiales bacterium]